MSRCYEGAWTQQQSEPPARLPADHVLLSGAVLFPGAFDQLGSPLVVFPVDGQASLSTALSKAEVVDFIYYCLSQHNKTQKSSLVSIVADLREASASSTRFIAETLLLLEQQKTVHSAYIIQPKRKDVLRLLGKLWGQSKSQPTNFKKVLLKEVFELSNYIDRSQLTSSLGGYLVYCHQSWAVFTKEMAAFEEHFVSVVQRLPACLSSLQALSRLPLPNSVPELQLFCSSNETRFQQLQRELGLEDLLGHCRVLLEKLRSPDLDPHFQAMAGTALFTLHFSSMLQNHRRITAAVQKVELLLEEVFSKARLQLHVLQMREAALQITEHIESLLQHKLQPYNIQMAGDAAEAERLSSEFHSSVYTPAMSLVVSAEEVVRTLTELLSDAPSRECWLLDLHRLKEKLHSTVTLTLQTLQAVSKYHRFYNKAHSWYQLVLSENFLQDLFSKMDRPRSSWGTLPTWRKRLFAFLKNNPPPNMEELVHLAHLSQVIPDKRLQQEGRQLSHRCMTLRQIIMSSEPLTEQLQMALQWQYELLQSSMVKRGKQTSPTDTQSVQEAHPRMEAPKVDLLRPSAMTERKLSSLSSFDSGFEGAGSSMLEGRAVTPDFVKRTQIQPQILEETASNLSDSGGFGSLGNSSRASVHIVPKVIPNSLDFEIKVKRSAAHPTNPWLSLPDDDLENLYTVTITPKQSLEQRDSSAISNSQKNEELCPGAPVALPAAWTLHSPCSLEDSELSPIIHVLSSTVTEPKDQATGAPSMLWDSYDLHEQYQDATEGVSAPSLKDWDIKEQENLIEVEKTLERADKILTEEECVLVQEGQLNDLLQTEVRPYPWVAWNDQMSLDERSKTNVVDLDLFGAESQFDTDFGAQPGAWRSKPDLCTEIKGVHALDQKILEENFKIHLLRQEGLEVVVQRNSDMLNEQNLKMQITKEKLEQESLDREPMRICQVKQQARRVIRCSIMSRTESEEVRAICNELRAGQSSSEGPYSKENLSPSCSSDPPQAKAVSRTSLYNEIGMKLQDDTFCPTSVSPVSLNTIVASANPVQPPSDLGVTPDSAMGKAEQGIERKASNPRPIPKPRKNTFSLNKLSEQHSTVADDGSAPPVDTVDTCVLSMNTEGVGAPALDTVNLIGLTSENTEGRGGAPPEDTGDVGGGAPPEDRIGAPPEDRIGAPPEDTGDVGGGAPPEDRIGAPPEDTGDGGGGAPPEDRIGAPPEDTGDVGGGAPPEDRIGAPPEDRIRAPPEDTGDGGGGAPAEDTGGGGAAPAEDTGGGGGAPAEDTGGGGGAPAEDTGGGGGAPAEDTGGGGGALTEDTIDMGETRFLGPNADLHTNNNNNNWLMPEGGKEEPRSTDKGPDQTEDFSRAGPNSRDTPVERVPPNSAPLYNVGKGGDVKWLGGTKMSATMIQDQLSINTTLFQPSDFGASIVLDTGSGLMKAGFANEDLPSVLFPTIIGVPKYEEVMNSSSEKDTYVGHEAQHMRGVLALRHPIKHGVICNWDDMERIWQHTFDLLRVDPGEHPVILTEAPMNPLENKQRTMEIMFEFFGVPYSYVAMQAVLALYAAGRTTGVVLDSGDGVTHSVPVYDGYVLPHAVQRFSLAGADVTAHLIKLLQEQGVCMRTTAEQEIVREMKEKCCYVALNYEVELRESRGEASYTMPDGKIVSLGSERIRAPEILFKPELIGRDHYGLHENMYKSILSSDLDLRRNFLGNILLSGGNTLLPGLPERLEAELSALVPCEPRSSVRVSSPSDRDFSVWRGGAVLANLPSFCGLCISQSEYEEYGPQIVHRKCF